MFTTQNINSFRIEVNKTFKNYYFNYSFILYFSAKLSQ